MPETKLDEFTQAYLEAAFWSSTEVPFGTCPGCGKDEQVLDRKGRQDDYVCSECSTEETDNEPPMDENYSFSDLAPEAFAKMVEDCRVFQSYNERLFTEENCPRCPGECSVTAYAAHDFWLTRNGHGCGFWDGDWAEPAASMLDAASKAFGECTIYVGDDGRLYLS